MHDQLTPREQIRLAHAEWSKQTFGNVGPVGPLKHLAKEALEAAVEPGHLDEWADIQFLLWDAQRRAGITDDQITAAMVAKLEVNKARKWPEPKDGEPRLHIKEDAPLIPDIGSKAVNDAAWTLHDMLMSYGPLNGGQFNNLKGCFYEALKVAFLGYQPPTDSEAQATLKRLAIIMAGNDSGGELAALTVTAKSLVDRCKALAVERDTLAALPPPFPLPVVPAHVFSRVAVHWPLMAEQVKQIYLAIGFELAKAPPEKVNIEDFQMISDIMNAQAADPAQCVSVGYTPQLTKYQPEPGISGKKPGWVLIDEHGIKQAVAWLWTHPNGYCDLTFPQTGALGRAAARIAGGWSYTPLAPCGEPSQELESGAKS